MWRCEFGYTCVPFDHNIGWIVIVEISQHPVTITTLSTSNMPMEKKCWEQKCGRISVKFTNVFIMSSHFCHKIQMVKSNVCIEANKSVVSKNYFRTAFPADTVNYHRNDWRWEKKYTYLFHTDAAPLTHHGAPVPTPPWAVPKTPSQKSKHLIFFI